jgi:LytS/YehU family sensor histidine kinase
LQAEFERLQDYLSLMQLRMGQRLNFELQLDPALANTPIPSLLLQPLVENAISHGLEPHVEGGTVRVSAQADGAQHLRIVVSDDGAGCLTPPTPGFGLRSVTERVASFYGGQGQVDIDAAPSGVTVTMKLPRGTP